MSLKTDTLDGQTQATNIMMLITMEAIITGCTPGAHISHTDNATDHVSENV